jgi:4'-phosphopantetheinyl transferase
LKLAPHEIHVWLAFDRDFHDERTRRAFEDLLAAEERATRARLRAPGLPHQYLVTRALQRTVLSAYAPGIAAADWRFVTGEHGKPALAPDFAGSGLHFNIAHTAGLVAMAVSSQGAIGVDVEHHGARRAPLDVAPRYFTEGEARELAHLAEADRTLRFYALWTLKESWLKATGEGLAGGLDRIAFNFADAGAAIGATLAGNEPGCWRFWQAAPSHEHLLALAHCGDSTAVDARIFLTSGMGFSASDGGRLRQLSVHSGEEQRPQP